MLVEAPVVHEHRGYQARSAVGGCGHNTPKASVLFIHGQSECADPAVHLGKVAGALGDRSEPLVDGRFLCPRNLAHNLAVHACSAADDIETARQDAVGVTAAV